MTDRLTMSARTCGSLLAGKTERPGGVGLRQRAAGQARRPWCRTSPEPSRQSVCSTVLVGGSYLGAISHTLTAIETLRARGLAIHAVVVSQSAEPDAPDFVQTVESVAAFAGDLKVIAAARGDGDWAAQLV